MIEQVRVKSHFIDLVFPGHVLGTEVDENGHLDRCKIEEKKREKVLKLLGLILIKKILICLIKLVKYKNLLLIRPKN